MDVGHMLSVNTLNNRIASWNTNELGEREGGGRAEGVCPTKEGGRRPTQGPRNDGRFSFLFVFLFVFPRLTHSYMVVCWVLPPPYASNAESWLLLRGPSILLTPRNHSRRERTHCFCHLAPAPAHPPHALPFLVSRFSFLETYRQGAPPSSSNKKVIFLFFL